MKNNWIRIFPFTVGNVRLSHNLYEPPIPPIKGRTRYKEPRRIPDAHDIILIPKEMYEKLNMLRFVYFCFVNGLQVFHSISRKMVFLNAFGNKELSSLCLSLRNIIDNLSHVECNDLKYEFGQYVQLHKLTSLQITWRAEQLDNFYLNYPRL